MHRNRRLVTNIKHGGEDRELEDTCTTLDDNECIKYGFFVKYSDDGFVKRNFESSTFQICRLYKY